MFSDNLVIGKQENIIVKKINKEYILVPLIDNVANMKSIFTMNETGAFLWDKIDGIKNIKQLAIELIDEFEVNEEEALIDTEQFLNKIKPLLIIK